MKEAIYPGVMMRPDFDIRGKRILVVGMARSGVAAALLARQKGADVTVNDIKTEETLGDVLDPLKGGEIRFCLGNDGTAELERYDLVIISPGVPLSAPVVQAALRAGIPLTGEMEFASRYCPCPYVAVTGTNGKTTTVTLLREIFQNAGRIAHAAGNIGYPLSKAVTEAKAEDMMVVEVSSFQLETTNFFHPLSAAVLNVTEDHMNRHGNMENYTLLKAHVFDSMQPEDTAVLNWEDEACRRMGCAMKAKPLYFSSARELENGIFCRGESVVYRDGHEERKICEAEEIAIPGKHNLENAMAAAGIAISCGVPAPIIRHTLRTFRGVEHRIEFVRTLDGVNYINDSKGTNVDSTVKAIEAMKEKTVLILGGYDKHVSFDPLAKAILDSEGKITSCVLIGETAPQIEDSLRRAGFTAFEHRDSLQNAVLAARSAAAGKGNVLFSPACASFDMFEDYEQRGRIFKQIVHELR